MKEALPGKIGSIKMLDNFYRNKKVLVTGHSGFKGSWLSVWLSMLDAEICGFSKDIPTNPSNFKSINIDKKIRHIIGDIKDINKLKKVFQDFKPEIVFHLAAQPLVRKSYKEPMDTFETNVLGTVNILECIKESSSVRAGVMITSDKAYRNQEWIWGYRENDLLGGEDPYSASKGCAELVINSYCKSFFQEGPFVASTRAGNVIGGGDWAEDRIVPDAVRAWVKKNPVIIRQPESTRPWQHVLEPLSGYLLLGKLLYEQGKTFAGQAYNFGPSNMDDKSVKDVLNSIKKYWDNAGWLIENHSSIAKESILLKLCCDKALSMLGWHSILSFEESMQMTALWYKSFYENKDTDMLKFSFDQIKIYKKKAKELGLPWSK
jgi:CDP-glucose 4,6-dehydratase